jgi:pilus assembly protein CpaD
MSALTYIIRRTVAVGTLALASLSLAACNDVVDPESPELAAQTVPPPFRVQSEVHHLSLAYTGGALGAEQRQSLKLFLEPLAAGNPQSVHVVIAGPVGTAEKAALNRALIADGVEPNKIDFDAGGGAGQLDVAAEVFTVLPPTCPRLSRVRIIGNENVLDSNWGCANITALSQQVADPRDLVAGESGGTTDSEVTSGAIDRMRHDKVKALIDTQGSQNTFASGG